MMRSCSKCGRIVKHGHRCDKPPPPPPPPKLPPMLNDSPCAERPADGDNKVKDLLGELRALAEQARYEADQVADGFETLTESQQNKLTIVVQNLHRIILYSKDILFAMKHKQP